MIFPLCLAAVPKGRVTRLVTRKSETDLLPNFVLVCKGEIRDAEASRDWDVSTSAAREDRAAGRKRNCTLALSQRSQESRATQFALSFPAAEHSETSLRANARPT